MSLQWVMCWIENKNRGGEGESPDEQRREEGRRPFYPSSANGRKKEVPSFPILPRRHGRQKRQKGKTPADHNGVQHQNDHRQQPHVAMLTSHNFFASATTASNPLPVVEAAMAATATDPSPVVEAAMAAGAAAAKRLAVDGRAETTCGGRTARVAGGAKRARKAAVCGGRQPTVGGRLASVLCRRHSRGGGWKERQQSSSRRGVPSTRSLPQRRLLSTRRRG